MTVSRHKHLYNIQQRTNGVEEAEAAKAAAAKEEEDIHIMGLSWVLGAGS